MADQHDYDGIKYREEKSSPLIFRVLFGGLIAWAVVFMGYYLFSGWSSDAEFQQKKKAKEAMLAKAAPSQVHKEGKAEDYLAMGKKDYAAKCAACHGAEGKGGIGPDLTQASYKYGKTEKGIAESITAGRAGGMPSFGKELTHEQVEGLVKFLQSLK